MSRWFRMYDELLDDPKVQRLAAEDFRGWVNLLCLASRNGGKLPPVVDIAFSLRETQDAVSTLLERLRSGGLIVRRSGGQDGAYDAPYKWEERQYKSDTSTDRVKRFRKRSRNTDETPPDTEAETEERETNVSPRERAQATRLADGWEPATLKSDTVSGQIITARGHEWAARALESFRNHWRSANGPNARKRDWQAAWANWIIEQDNRDGRRHGQRTDSMGRHQPADGLSSTARAALAVFGPPGTGNQ